MTFQVGWEGRSDNPAFAGVGDQQLTLFLWDGVSCAGSEGRAAVGSVLCVSATPTKGTEVAHEEQKL